MNTVNNVTTVEPTMQGSDAQIAAHAAQQQSQGGSTGAVPISAPAGPQLVTFSAMCAVRRWLIAFIAPDGKKLPYYVNGQPRHGKLDSPEDVAQFASYAEAKAAVATGGADWLLGFALGPDDSGGFWQGIDLDDVEQNCLADIANTLPGYVELSPSGKGCHAIGYGRNFNTLGSNRTGIEAYAHGRYFTVTESTIRNSAPICLADHVEQILVPIHSKNRIAAANADVGLFVPDTTIADLRSALLSMRSDEYSLWINMGLALHELGDRGRALWLEWSSTSKKFNAKEAAEKWDSFNPKNTGHLVVFVEAERQGWVNPCRNDVQPQPTGQQASLEARIPSDILRNIVPPPYDFDDVPRLIGEVSYYQSKSTGHDQSGIIVSCVTAAASMIDDAYVLAVRPESNWYVSARQWSFLCGGAAAGKSPSIRAATLPIKRIHNRIFSQWLMENEDAPADKKSPMPALYTSDATVPALSDCLKDNPRGLLMLTEEFSSWVGSVDSSDRGEASKNRGDWLQLRDGGARQIYRVVRGAVYVPNWGVSVLAACTPNGLAKQMKNMPEDGLIQRFVPCIMRAPSEETSGDAREALATWDQMLEWAYEFTTQNSHIQISFDSEAQKLFDEEAKSIRDLVIATEEFYPSYASHLGKHPGMLAEIALTFHVFSGAIPGLQISATTMSFAIRYMRKVRRHAHALYSSILNTAPAFELAQALARSIVASEARIATCGRDWMTQHCQAFKKADDRLRREAVQMLEDACWLEARQTSRLYGGWPGQYFVNPRVFDIFAREGERWRARRAAVRDAIGEAAA